MKKITLDTAKLQLKKDKITSLTTQELTQLNGGYIISKKTGDRTTCRGGSCYYTKGACNNN